MNLLRQLGNSVSKIGVRDLGTPTMPLYEPTMATEKATFAMS